MINDDDDDDDDDHGDSSTRSCDISWRLIKS